MRCGILGGSDRRGELAVPFEQLPWTLLRGRSHDEAADDALGPRSLATLLKTILPWSTQISMVTRTPFLVV